MVASVGLAGGDQILAAPASDATWPTETARGERILERVHEGWIRAFGPVEETSRPPSYVIRSVAGSTDVADGVPAVEAALFGPCAVAIDSGGDLFVADSRNQRIRKVDASGVISTFAGTGDWGYGGDGGRATQARLSFPCGLALDSAGNLYVSDVENHRVRRIEAATGVISTFAGSGEPGFRSDGDLAIKARLTLPTGVAVDPAGAVYVADSGNNRVRWIDASGVIRTLRGRRLSQYAADGSPAQASRFGGWGVAVGRSGSVYVAEPKRRRVSRLDIPTGVLTTLASSFDRGYEGDGGPSTWTRLVYPQGVAADMADNVYIADPLGSRVHRIDSVTGRITTLPATTPRRAGGLVVQTGWGSPRGVAADVTGDLYVTDSTGHRVRMMSASTGDVTTLAGTGDWSDGWTGGPAAQARFASPVAPVLDAGGNLFFVDSNRVWRLDTAGTVSVFAGTGEPRFGGDGGLATASSLRSPRALAIDAAGNIYVGECGRVRRIDAVGTITTIAGSGRRSVLLEDRVAALAAELHCIESLAVDGLGNVYLLESENGILLDYVLRIDSEGSMSVFAGKRWPFLPSDTGPDYEIRLSRPTDLAVDSAGNVYVADSGNNRVVRIDVSSRSIATILDARHYRPRTVAVDEFENVFVGGGNQIRLIDAGGTVSVIAGTGLGGFSGDGKPAVTAELSVSGIAIASNGVVWFTDPSSRRIRVLEPWRGR